MKFTNSNRCITSFCVALLCLITNLTFAQRLTVKNGKIVKDGNPITLRGVNFGNWLLWEGYMMNLDKEGTKSHSQIRNNIKSLLGNNSSKISKFETDWRNNYITNEDFKQAKNKGFNVVRVPYDYRMFWNFGTKKVKNDGFKWLDKALKYANDNQIYVVFCMHAAPGFQNPDHHSNNPGTSVNFWKSDWSNVNIAKKVWAHIANRYKNRTGEKWLAGYDLLNEPVLEDNKDRLLRAYKEMTAEIRKKDKNHLILAEGNFYASDFYDILERWDNKLVFANHYYGPQGQSDPNPDLRKIIDQGAKLGIPVFCNEFGENTNTWLKAARTDYDIEGVSWAFWAWKRQNTDRAIYSFKSTSNWDRITNYIKDKIDKKPNLRKPSIRQTESGLKDLIKNIKLSNATFKSEIHKRLIPSKPIGKYVSLKFNRYYMTSNNGRGSMKFNKTNRGSWEKFKLVDAGDNKVALLGNNNRYVNSQNGTKAMTCNSRNIGGWEAFEWIDVNGKIALKGFNGKYVSSEGGGNKGINCNRNTATGGWEQFSLKSTSRKLIEDFDERINSTNEPFLVYPNPTTDILYFNNLNLSENYNITVYNSFGSVVLQQNVTSKNINVSGISSGSYFIKITTDQNDEFKEIFIKK